MRVFVELYRKVQDVQSIIKLEIDENGKAILPGLNFEGSIVF